MTGPDALADRHLTGDCGEADVDNGEFADGNQLLAVFAYVRAPRAELYIAVMDAVFAARDRFLLQLRPADLTAELHIDRDLVGDALEFLARCGALHRTYDAAEAETLAESTITP